MNLILDIAWTHVRSARARRVAVAGVATGVGFSIMMASLMLGSQDDFTGGSSMRCRISRCRTSAATRRLSPRRIFASGPDSGLTPEARRPASRIRSRPWPRWKAGSRAMSRPLKDAGDPALCRSRRRRSVTGIDPQREPSVSRCPSRCAVPRLPRSTARPMRSSSATVWPRSSALASAPTSPCRPARACGSAPRWSGCFHSGVRSVDEGTAYVLIKTAQILSQQTGLINELRVRVADP